MLADFLGKGWNFPVQHGGGHAIAISPGEESIQQSIWIILATAPGERVMRPDFGCGLHHLVRDALVKWEPRIDVLDVDTEVRGRGEVLLINVHYRVRTTNNFFNLVYPFYLGVGS
jgi:phage baseplate assembly protein W